MLGFNLLNAALSAIGSQVLKHRRYVSREVNALGHSVATYGDVSNIRGSVQFVPRAKYERFGLEMNRVYLLLYTASENIHDLSVDDNGDKIQYNQKTYQVTDTPSDWRSVNGWAGVMCVQIEDEEWV